MTQTMRAGIWNYGDLFDALAGVVPAQQVALAHADRVITWGELTGRTNRIGRALLAEGAQPGEKLAWNHAIRSMRKHGVGFFPEDKSTMWTPGSA